MPDDFIKQREPLLKDKCLDKLTIYTDIVTLQTWVTWTLSSVIIYFAQKYSNKYIKLKDNKN